MKIRWLHHAPGMYHASLGRAHARVWKCYGPRSWAFCVALQSGKDPPSIRGSHTSKRGAMKYARACLGVLAREAAA